MLLVGQFMRIIDIKILRHTKLNDLSKNIQNKKNTNNLVRGKLIHFIIICSIINLKKSKNKIQMWVYKMFKLFD